MFCPYCKKEIEDDSLFCSFCGETIEQKKLCVNCSEELYPQIATPDAEKKIIDNKLENDKAAKKISCGKFSTSLLTIISASLAIITIIIIIIIFAVKTNVSTPAPARIEYEAETGSNNSFAADGEQSPDTSSITENDTRDEPLYVVKTADGQETENYDLAFTFEEYLAALNRVCAEVFQGQMPPFTYYRNKEAFLFANYAFADYQSVFPVQNREEFLKDVFGVKPHGIWGSDPENGNSKLYHSISNNPVKYTKTLNEFYPMIDELLDTSKTKIIVGRLLSPTTQLVASSQIENEVLANINIYVFVDACTGFVKAISCYTHDNDAGFTESGLDQFIKNGTTCIDIMQLDAVLELINRKLENQNLSAESAEKERHIFEQTIIHGCNYYCAFNFVEEYFEFEEYNENVPFAELTVSSTIWFDANNQLANSSRSAPAEASTEAPAPSADKNLSVSLTQEQQTEWMLQIKALAYAAYDNMQGTGKATPEMLLANPDDLRMYIYASTDYLFYDAWRKYDWEEEKRLTALEDAFGAGCIADDYEAYIPESAIKDKLRNMFGSAAVEGFNFAGIFDNGFFHYEEGDPGDYLALSECEKTNWNDMSQIVFSYEYGYIEEDPDETLGNIVISTQADTTSPYGCVVKQIEWKNIG